MWSVLRTAWRVVARRAVADRAILAAAFLTILLAITLLAAGPIYADAVTISSLRRALVDAPITEANVVITTRVEPDTFEDDDSVVVDAMNDAFGTVGARIFRRGTSDSYSLEGLPGDHQRDLVVFSFFTGIEERATLIDGAWPGESDRIEIALLADVAEALDVSVGDLFGATSRRGDPTTHPILVAGIYEIDDVTDPYWLENELDLTGVSESTSFTTLGPLVTSGETFFTTVASGSSQVRWSVFPDHAGIDADDVGIIVGELDHLQDRLNQGRDLGNQMQVETELATVLRDTQRSLLVTRSAVMIVTVQLAILAGYALLLTAGLLADTREVEATTLRARGASRGQMLGMTAMEGVMVALPAFLVGPPLAAALLTVFNRVGPLAGIGLTVDPTLTTASWVLAGLAAIAAVGALVLPGYQAAGRFGNIRAARARTSKSLARRAGADIALLLVAAIGIWQLTVYGTPLTRNVQGVLGIDPLLVAAPAISLLAGAVLALRILPLMARAGAILVERGRGLIATLGVWYLGRQPKRYARSALMLMLAVAIGIFALAYDATWTASQQDQSGFTTGADIRVHPNRQPATAIPDHLLHYAYGRLDDGLASTPVVRARGEVAGLALPITYAIVDASDVPDVMVFRSDQAASPVADVLNPVGAARPQLPGPALDGRPQEVSLLVTLQPEPLSPDLLPNDPRAYEVEVDLRAVMVDASGIPFRVDFGTLDPVGNSVRMSATLYHESEGGEQFAPLYPVRLVGFETRMLAPFDPFYQNMRLSIDDVRIADDGSNWRSVPLPGMGEIEAETSVLRLEVESPTVAVVPGEDGGFAMRIGSGTTDADSRQPVYHMTWLGTAPLLEALPVVVSDDLAEGLGLADGSALPLDGLPEAEIDGLVVGRLKTFPTIDPRQELVVVVDYPTYVAATFGPGVFTPQPEYYWLGAQNVDQEEVASQLANEPYLSANVVTWDESLLALVLDPVSLGTIGSLMMGLAAAALLAAIGFMVNVVVSTRERLGQFALLRAVGLSTRQLLTWVSIENGVTVLFALVFGTGLGLLLANVVLPLTATTQQATEIVPEMVIVLPWAKIGVLELGVLLVLGIAVLVVSRMLNRLDLASLLRSGDE